MANEVQVAFSDSLNDKLVAVSDALPKDFNRERFVQNCLTVMNEKPELAKINRALVQQGLLKAAYLGLDFMNKECYLIPYGNTVQFQTDYKGECKFVKRYSIRKIKDIYAKVVREGDVFSEEIVGGLPVINFKPVPFNSANIIGAFAVCLYEDGGMDYETMSLEDINSVRNNYSKAANSKAWKNSFGEMAKKTVLRRLCKHIETDFETIEARMAWEDGGDADFSTGSYQKGNPDEVVNAFEDMVEETTFREIPEEE